jgi:hypothetical protein
VAAQLAASQVGLSFISKQGIFTFCTHQIWETPHNTIQEHFTLLTKEKAESKFLGFDSHCVMICGLVHKLFNNLDFPADIMMSQYIIHHTEDCGEVCKCMNINASPHTELEEVFITQFEGSSFG